MRSGLSLRGHGRASANHGFREAFHFFELRAELKQDEIDSDGFKLRHALSNLFRRAD